MNYSLEHFKNWTTFASWDALKSWLTSSEGGSLRIIEPKESSYAIIRYVKGQSNFSLQHVPWCRSVVLNKETRLPVSVAPPKAAKISDTTLNEVKLAEEFVDGTMINVFCEFSKDAFVATRSRIGANTKFYNTDATFESMFADAMKAHSVSDYKDLLPSKENATSCFTSVILQHPSNRIVKKIDSPTFLIAHQGWVHADGTIEIVEDSQMFSCPRDHTLLHQFFEIPYYEKKHIEDARNIEEWVLQQSLQRGFGWQGLVLKDLKGNRYRVRSQVYETVRRIRGNEASAEERFARLRKTGTQEQYLSFYPEDRELFYELEGRLRKNTRKLFEFYADVFRAKNLPYHELPWPYKHHVSVLHNDFKNTLRSENKKVDLSHTIRYVNALELADLYNMCKIHKLTTSTAATNT